MRLRTNLFLAAALAGAAVLVAPARIAAAEPTGQITILYDAFGTDAAMKKDWGFSALVEISGKRILFDTGNDPDIFAANIKAKNIDLTSIDFVVLSHRHSDHMAGLNHVLSVNPTVKIYAPREGFGIYGSSLPSSFYRKDESLPPEMRYYDGKPPEVMKFGTAWQRANIEPDRQDVGNRPRHHVDRACVGCPRHEGAKGAVPGRQHRGWRRARGRLRAPRDREDCRGREGHQSQNSLDRRRLPPRRRIGRGHCQGRGNAQGHVQGGKHRSGPLHRRADLRSIEAGLR